ncbi:MAG: LacI family DNA-binding transcriptional regulator [Thermomicrobiales bacterium]
MKEIARQADVSVATVSRVLNNHANVRGSVRQRVLDVIDEVGYEPDPIARSMRTRATSTVGFIIRDLVDPVFSTMAQGVDDVLRAHDYTLLLSTSSHDPERDAHQLALLRGRRVDGFILAISEEASPALVAEVRKTTRPIVLLDREMEDTPTDAVLTDYLSGTREAIAYLASLGHRRIAYIGGTLSIRPGRERLRAFTTSMRDAGLPTDPELIRTSSFAPEFGQAMTRELLDAPSPPTALLAAGNQISVGVLQALRERRVRLPDDLSLICVDDVDLLRHGNPPVTVITRPFARIGQLAAERLLQRIRSPEAVEYQRILVPTSLIIRESCQPYAS